jgi:hypothetical protein
MNHKTNAIFEVGKKGFTLTTVQYVPDAPSVALSLSQYTVHSTQYSIGRPPLLYTVALRSPVPVRYERLAPQQAKNHGITLHNVPLYQLM